MSLRSDVPCAVCIAADDDLGRERLVRSFTRPPFALDRIEVRPRAGLPADAISAVRRASRNLCVGVSRAHRAPRAARSRPSSRSRSRPDGNRNLTARRHSTHRRLPPRRHCFRPRIRCSRLRLHPRSRWCSSIRCSRLRKVRRAVAPRLAEEVRHAAVGQNREALPTEWRARAIPTQALESFTIPRAP
jgi:hypothetical protein